MMTLLSLMMSMGARASCVDVLDGWLAMECMNLPELFEHRGGITQVYACDIEPDVPAFVAILTYDPASNVIPLEAVQCSGSDLFLSSDPDALLSALNVYSDAISADGGL